jgi:hypothetical protein
MINGVLKISNSLIAFIALSWGDFSAKLAFSASDDDIVVLHKSSEFIRHPQLSHSRIKSVLKGPRKALRSGQGLKRWPQAPAFSGVLMESLCLYPKF